MLAKTSYNLNIRKWVKKKKISANKLHNLCYITVINQSVNVKKIIIIIVEDKANQAANTIQITLAFVTTHKVWNLCSVAARRNCLDWKDGNYNQMTETFFTSAGEQKRNFSWEEVAQSGCLLSLTSWIPCLPNRVLQKRAAHVLKD